MLLSYYVVCNCSGEEGTSVRRLVGSASGTQQSTAAVLAKGSAEQTGKTLTHGIPLLSVDNFLCFVFVNIIMYFCCISI